MITREQDRDMILNPSKWPLLYLPLKRKQRDSTGFPETAVFTAPLSTMRFSAVEPITIRLGTIFDDLPKLSTKTYPNVDALLDDGWVVD